VKVSAQEVDQTIEVEQTRRLQHERDDLGSKNGRIEVDRR
jgi:hypothetical protein